MEPLARQQAMPLRMQKMSLVFENALMPSENQQVLRLRHLYFMTNWLPPKELATKRCAKNKPWVVGLLVGLFGPMALVFAYRQRKFDYVFYFLITTIVIVAIRTVFPSPPLTGSSFIPLINWTVYSRYGPGVIHGLIQLSLATELKGGRSWLSNKKWNFSNLFSFEDGSRPQRIQEEYIPGKPKSKIKDLKPVATPPTESRLQELLVLKEKGLISQEEYDTLRKKTLGL